MYCMCPHACGMYCVCCVCLCINMMYAFVWLYIYMKVRVHVYVCSIYVLVYTVDSKLCMYMCGVCV